MTLCSTLERVAYHTWSLLYRAHMIHASIYEETLTELNLLEIQESHPVEIWTDWYSKKKESINGADWEWVFLSKEGSSIFRIQAKRLDIQSQSYEALDKIQTKKLIDYSKTSQDKKIPLYVFYNCLDKTSLTYNYQFGCLPRKSFLSLGCTIASAYDILSIKSKKIVDIAPIMSPWSALACCSDPNLGLATNAANYVLKVLGRKHYENVDVSEYISKEAPSYVYKLLHSEKLSDKDWGNIQANRLIVIKD